MEKLAVYGILGLATLGLAEILYHAAKYVYEQWIENEEDYPPGLSVKQSNLLFMRHGALACNVSAGGIFFLLTGYDPDIMNYFGGQIQQTDSTEKRVHYLGYTWERAGKKGETSSVHFLVYYDGYVIQSYRTSRYTRCKLEELGNKWYYSRIKALFRNKW